MKKPLETTLETPIVSEPEIPEQDRLTLLSISPATDAEILMYLRRSTKLAEIAALAERDLIILAMCEQFGLTVSDSEWQADGDTFRVKHQLWGIEETSRWLKEQRITIQDWSQGIRVALLAKKLKEYLFSATLESDYLAVPNNYRRVTLSQILLSDLITADNIIQKLQTGKAAFSILASQYSQDKESQENGGFLGTRCLVELLPEIKSAIIDAHEGEVIGAIKTKLGYHIIKVEKWFSAELNQLMREQIMDRMFSDWLNNLSD